MFCYDETEYQPSDAERREAADVIDFERAPGHLTAHSFPPRFHADDPEVNHGEQALVEAEVR